MNPSTALATVLADELVRNGVRDAVLAPGSRSAALALALHDADAAGRLRLHVRIDERSAGFLALGLARASGRPVPVVTTSGTAGAHLHAAVLEASYAGVPLVVLTADRPPELRETGANQTVDQLGLYGRAVRLFHEMGAPEARAGQGRYWRALLARALAAARGDLTADPGPVHLNVAFREPLLPDGDRSWPERLDGRGEGPWTTAAPAGPQAPFVVDDPELPTVVVAGAGDGGAGAHLGGLFGWPVLAEPVSGSFVPPYAVPAAPLVALVAAEGRWFPGHRLRRVVVTGRPTLSRAVLGLLADPGAETWAVGGPRWPDPTRTVRRVVPGLVPAAGRHAPAEWAAAWTGAGAEAHAAVQVLLAGEDEPSGPAVAALLHAALPDGAALVVGASQPIRDLHLAAGPRPGVTPYANRGASGIDGTVSTALGVALAADGPTYALLGDLTFLHDTAGLVLGPDEPRADLTVVVVNDDGGGIFTLLEHGDPAHDHAFERVFGTPHGVDLAALCAATGTAHRQVGRIADLAAELRTATGGVRVLEVCVDRSRHRDLHARIADAARHALS